MTYAIASPFMGRLAKNIDKRCNAKHDGNDKFKWYEWEWKRSWWW